MLAKAAQNRLRIAHNQPNLSYFAQNRSNFSHAGREMVKNSDFEACWANFEVLSLLRRISI